MKLCKLDKCIKAKPNKDMIIIMNNFRLSKSGVCGYAGVCCYQKKTKRKSIQSGHEQTLEGGKSILTQ